MSLSLEMDPFPHFTILSEDATAVGTKCSLSNLMENQKCRATCTDKNLTTLKDDPSVEMHYGADHEFSWNSHFNPSKIPVLYLFSKSLAYVIPYMVSAGQTVIVRAQVSLRPHILKVDIIGIKTSEVGNETASIPLGF